MDVLSWRLTILFRNMVRKELTQPLLESISGVKVMLSYKSDVRAIFQASIWLRGKK